MEPEVSMKLGKSQKKYIHPSPWKYMQLVTYIGNNDLIKYYKKTTRTTDLTEKAMGIDQVNITNGEQ